VSRNLIGASSAPVTQLCADYTARGGRG